MEKLQSTLEQQIGEQISSTIVKRGWNYYRNGNVQKAEATMHHTLTGIVRGSDVYAIVIDAEHFKFSHCTCPFGGFCKHMAAVFFQYCDNYEGGFAQAERAYFRILGLLPASELMNRGAKEAAAQEQAEEQGTGSGDGAEQWLSWMEAEYGDSWKKCRHSLHALQPVLSSLKGLSRDWDKRLQRLHWITGILFVLEQAEHAINSVDSFSRYYHEISFQRMAEPWLEHAITLVNELEPEGMEELELSAVPAITAFAKRRALLSDKQLFEWGEIYIALCEKLSSNKAWFENERSQLNEEYREARSEERDASFYTIVLAMLSFYDERDLDAIRFFSDCPFDRCQRLIYPCAAQRMEEGKWALAEQWMSFLYERVYANRNFRNIGPFMALCRKADEDKGEQPVWMTYMTELLPYSYSELSEHWLSKKQYPQWADLQLLIGIKPEDIQATELREAAKAAPHALMPLYHQAVEAAIQSRNRQGYRMAVKHLKKLEKLYKTAKETHKWQVYLNGLTVKHQRLRALQEELWKGKLVT